MRYKLCSECRAMIRKATREALQKKQKAGVAVGRPRKQVTTTMLKRILAGTLTVAEAAQLAEVTPTTVRRRLRELAKKKRTG